LLNPTLRIPWSARWSKSLNSRFRRPDRWGRLYLGFRRAVLFLGCRQTLLGVEIASSSQPRDTTIRRSRSIGDFASLAICKVSTAYFRYCSSVSMEAPRTKSVNPTDRNRFREIAGPPIRDGRARSGRRAAAGRVLYRVSRSSGPQRMSNDVVSAPFWRRGMPEPIGGASRCVARWGPGDYPRRLL
jgi:hypothetical protein